MLAFIFLMRSAFGYSGDAGSHLPEKDVFIPTASFTANTVCQGLPTIFTNNSTTLSGSIVANIWDFGDGQGSSVPNPQHIYTNSGTFAVTLTVINSQGDVDDFTASVTVHPSGSLNFLISSANQCVSSTFAFTNLSNIPSGSFTSYSWDFGDGATTTGLNSGHMYSSYGTYPITLTTTTNNNCVKTFTKTLEVYPEAAVNFQAQPQCFGKELEFINTTQVASGLVSYSWNFGDAATSAEINPKHAYATSGNATVILKATTEKGCITTTSKPVTTYPVPAASFTALDHCFGINALFDSQSTISSGTMTHSWNFGDGSNSSDVDPLHTYTTTGNFAVTLTISSNHNCVASVSKFVRVIPKPIVDFSISNICFGENAEFFNNSTIGEGEIVYNWDFGDGTSSSSVNPIHQFQTYGDYDVTLLASTPQGGCAESITKSISVFQQPRAVFTAKDNCLDSTIVFKNNSVFVGNDIVYTWEFGDGRSSASKDVTHQYTSAQTYLVTLKATALNGCADQLVHPVKVFPQPQINFLADNVCDQHDVNFRNFSSILSGTISYVWQFGDQTASTGSEPIHLYASHGSYPVKVTVTSDAGCVAVKEKTIVVYPLPATNFDAPPVCDSKPVAFNNLSTIASGNITDYEWDFGDQTNSIVKNPTKEFLKDGTYRVKLTSFSDRGCQRSVEKDVIIHPVPIANFNVRDVCAKETIHVNNTSTIREGSLTYYWDFGDNSNAVATSPSHDYETYGVYNILLVATSDTGCKDSVSRAVAIFSLPQVNAGEDQTVSQGYPAQLNATGAIFYRWEPIEGLSNSSIPDPVATPMVTTEYIVYGKDSYGCENSDAVTILVDAEFKLVASNVLTPDGNGKNDTWIVENIGTFGDVHVRVYDRWGKQVYEQQAYKNDWNGLSGRDILPDGTYYYFITFETTDKEYKGALTIIRNKQ